MENNTINTSEIRLYVKPSIHDHGDAIELTKGDPGDKAEGNQIFWGDFVSTVELPQRFE